MLVGRSDRFEEETPVWFWTRVIGGEPGDVLRHVWIYEGRPVMSAKLAIGGPHWRTYTRYRLPPDSAGSWVVEARAAGGQVLARQQFLCLPPSELRP
jgi:hypothetical protein